jgi:hypothetical protein
MVGLRPPSAMLRAAHGIPWSVLRVVLGSVRVEGAYAAGAAVQGEPYAHDPRYAQVAKCASADLRFHGRCLSSGLSRLGQYPFMSAVRLQYHRSPTFMISAWQYWQVSVMYCSRTVHGSS